MEKEEKNGKENEGNFFSQDIFPFYTQKKMIESIGTNYSGIYYCPVENMGTVFFFF